MRNSPQVHVRTCLALQRPPASSSQSGSTLRDASISCFSFQLDQFSHSFSAWLCQFWSWIFRRTRIGGWNQPYSVGGPTDVRLKHLQQMFEMVIIRLLLYGCHENVTTCGCWQGAKVPLGANLRTLN
ncbi:hypothetical protein AV530_016455 [Patagioenas fasciata monilis]|uniref:Uncharacterized protein n=1 Tax=Patagioenas fasciata monilis TaxID=372326 RepID=A0A1V4J2V8_PATFA|nr:hypothetical protein AV530_016455 [Patagioenas fasciata monilis]